MRHARAIVAQMWPQEPVIEAGRRLVWIPDGKGGRFPRSTSEDIFGVFDICVVGFSSETSLIQVTTETKSRSTVSARKRKIEKWIETLPPPEPPHPEIFVWSWVRRKHMRVWRWIVSESGWQELDPFPSPEMAKNRRVHSPNCDLDADCLCSPRRSAPRQPKAL